MKDEKDINLGNDAKADEPILTIQKVKSTKSIIYGIAFAIWVLATVFVCIGLLNTDKIFLKIISILVIFILIFWYILTFKLEKIECCNDFLIAKYSFFQRKIYYADIKYCWNKRTIITNDFIINHKKPIYTIFISRYLFDKADLDTLIDFLNNKT
ncbi:hypothetical protein [Campylobacter gastrosuis]|uniref:Uncharacterized protein n=1 Tax=Campylobacter gastrosuis TaxID=2974576 RepID=A0ABT7HTV1_9BACT|nr:hypothetical protein [Campylobacter gastrosuis]MDL0089873.1 hypothetical protein [Campylobacter gastrosuis]